MEPTDISSLLRELRAGLERIYGPRLRELWLFGSRARGDAEPESDIDVALVLDDFRRAPEEIERTSELLATLSLAYDCVINLLPIRERDWQRARLPIIESIRKEGIPA